MPEEELAELEALYRDRGLSMETARAVARELTASDALAAHAEMELGIDAHRHANPWAAAWASLISFALGSVLPLLAISLPAENARIPVTFVAVVVTLSLTGWVAAWLGGASAPRAIIRNVAVSVVTMVVTLTIGNLVGGGAGVSQDESMTNNPEQTARGILEELQDAVAAKDLDGLARLVSDDVVFFGTAEANLDRDQTMAYLAREMAREGIIRWEWDRVAILSSAPDSVSFAALGTVGIENPAGRPDGDRAEFRLTCLAVRHDGRWLAPALPRLDATGCVRKTAGNRPETGRTCVCVSCGRYRDRTDDLFRVREARYRCANRPGCRPGGGDGI